MAGFILIDRKIQDWKWWHNGTGRSMWLYLLIEANWKEGYLSDGTCVPRGSLARSLRRMADESGYSVNTVRYWLKKFTEEGAISVSTTHGYTVINILKYGDYQDLKSYHGTPTDTLTDTPTDTEREYFDTPADTVTDTLTDTDRTQKTHKTQKTHTSNTGTRMPRPSIEEVQEYITLNNYAVNAERFIDYYESNGWKVGRNPMKDWKACVRTWHKKEEERRAQQRSQKGVLPF